MRNMEDSDLDGNINKNKTDQRKVRIYEWEECQEVQIMEN